MAGHANGTDTPRTRRRSSSPTWQDQALHTALAAAGDQLGRPHTQHWRSIHHWQALRLIAVVAAVGITALCCAAPAVYFSDARGVAWAFAVGGLLVLALAYAVDRITRPRRVTGVVTFEGGLVIVDDGRPTVVPWTQVRDVRRKITEYRSLSSGRKTRRTAYDITVEIEGHPPFRFTDQFQDVEMLTARIESEVANRRSPSDAA
ncbi:MAG: hypothetical protein IRY85_22550 [Micromonosporaceae bacterium]|nr:hypothetical protein [Micromonosporaceae bacterium]